MNSFCRPESTLINETLTGGAALSLAYVLRIQDSDDPFIDLAQRVVQMVNDVSALGSILFASIPQVISCTSEKKLMDKVLMQYLEKLYTEAIKIIGVGKGKPTFTSNSLEQVDEKSDAATLERIVQNMAGIVYAERYGIEYTADKVIPSSGPTLSARDTSLGRNFSEDEATSVPGLKTSSNEALPLNTSCVNELRYEKLGRVGLMFRRLRLLDFCRFYYLCPSAAIARLKNCSQLAVEVEIDRFAVLPRSEEVDSTMNDEIKVKVRDMMLESDKEIYHWLRIENRHQDKFYGKVKAKGGLESFGTRPNNTYEDALAYAYCFDNFKVLIPPEQLLHRHPGFSRTKSPLFGEDVGYSAIPSHSYVYLFPFADWLIFLWMVLISHLNVELNGLVITVGIVNSAMLVSHLQSQGLLLSNVNLDYVTLDPVSSLWQELGFPVRWLGDFVQMLIGYPDYSARPLDGLVPIWPPGVTLGISQSMPFVLHSLRDICPLKASKSTKHKSFLVSEVQVLSFHLLLVMLMQEAIDLQTGDIPWKS
ncbi:hypothetical protein CPB84DRAFT_1752785 [Gymnopilus junonius]|uniref:Uncharacterized protein n=1 Tax=Gymnopilus junonius TaxID=109634 RepID=A0A9P5NBN4_GYMJU|nr:hypothetical protein CPB84DRAFT_1752785 [Gymnopilus junonius]